MRAARQPTWGAFFIYNSISSGIPFGEDMGYSEMAGGSVR